MVKYYLPDKLPIENLDYRSLIRLIGDANAELARYDGLLQGIINPEVLLSPLTTQEAVLSSKIEGTQATLDEVLKHEAGMLLTDEQKEKDVQEIVNYRKVLILAEKELKKHPLSLFLIRQMHFELMQSVRGKDKDPGKFRKKQNWIGKPGASIEQASFVPPEPHLVPEYMEKLEKYMQTDSEDVVVQTAIVHGQFELIHPFADGNGRIGRLLIPLFLYSKGRLTRPMFYMSEYLEAHRDIYYEKLRSISRNKDWNGWVQFFLMAVKEQAKLNSEKVKQILQLYNQMKEKIAKLTRSQYSIQILDFLFDKPIFTPSDAIKKTKIPKPSFMPILKQFQEAGILSVLREARGRSPAILAFGNLVNIVEGKKIL